jgi:hypothetical protein
VPTRNEYRAANVKDFETFPNVHVQRATDAAFTTPVDVETKAADTTNEATVFIDTGGTTSSYYRHRGETADALSWTDWSPSILYGDYVVRQQVIRDCSTLGVVPSGIESNDWDSWRDQGFLDMQAKGLGRPADIQELSFTAGQDEWKDLNADIRRVTQVEVWSGAYYWTSVRGWDQRGRQLRVYRPLGTPYVYKVYGRGELRDLTDLDDELWGVLYWAMKWKYILKRQAELVDFRPYLGKTKQITGLDPMSFQRLADQAYAKFLERISDTLRNEGVPSGEGTR